MTVVRKCDSHQGGVKGIRKVSQLMERCDAHVRGVRGDIKIPTCKPHTNHKKPYASSHTLAPTTICDLSHSVCGSPLPDLGHISSVTYVCHHLWFVCGHRKKIMTSPLKGCGEV